MVVIKGDGGSVRLGRRKFMRQALVAALSLAGMPVLAVAGESQIGSVNRVLVARFADVILPRTTSPSATDVNADEFVHLIATVAKGEAFADRFYRGAKQLRSQIEGRYVSSLDAISDNDIAIVIRDVLRAKADTDAYWFLFRFKQLLVVGWALTKRTAESAFAYRGGIYQYLPRTESSQIIMSNYIDKEYLNL